MTMSKVETDAVVGSDEKREQDGNSRTHRKSRKEFFRLFRSSIKKYSCEKRRKKCQEKVVKIATMTNGKKCDRILAK